MCSIAFGASAILARFPARWNHLAEKESRQINMLEQILVGEVMQLRRDLLYVSPLRPGSMSAKPAEGQITDLPDKNIFNYFAAPGINTLDRESSQ